MEGIGLRRAFTDLLPRIAAAARAHYGANLVSLAVFGSVARGTPGPESDVDVLVVCRDLPAGRSRRIEDFLAVEDEVAGYLSALARRGIHTSLSPVIKTVAEAEAGSHLFLDMTRDVVILHDPEGFLGDLLAGEARRLAEMGARRVEQGSRWYWDLAPDPGGRDADVMAT